jgi:peptide/nickel transport system ATP-binding protein
MTTDTTDIDRQSPVNGVAPVVVKNLSVGFSTDRGTLNAVRDLTLQIFPGEILGIVGESGSGKSTLAHGILGLLDQEVVSGEIRVKDIPTFDSSRRQIQNLRRRHVATILQDPVGSLNPVRTVRSQLRESASASGIDRGLRDEKVGEALADVGLNQREVLHAYPHQLSGGMNQRVAIAMALLKDPDILIADEPTSALDVRTQASIIRLMLDIRDRRGTAIMIVTHDLELAVGSCDRVGVMYAGSLMEIGGAKNFATTARHPYSQALMAAAPAFGQSKRVRPIPGRFDTVLNNPPGCPFRDRCQNALEQCSTEFPPSRMDATTYWCWNPIEARADKEDQSDIPK